jgi:HK97 family phage prohead protease
MEKDESFSEAVEKFGASTVPVVNVDPDVYQGKSVTLAPVEVEIKADDTERGVIHGYAAYFNNIDRHGDIITPESLKQKSVRVPLLLNHDTDDVVGHAVVTEDEKGYAYKGVLAVDSESDTLRERARYAYALVKEGHIRHNSIGFIPEQTEFAKRTVDGKERTVRLLKRNDLGEVSLVPVPANPKAENFAVKGLSQDEMEALVKQVVDQTVSKTLEALQATEVTESPSEPENPYRVLLRRRYGLS